MHDSMDELHRSEARIGHRDFGLGYLKNSNRFCCEHLLINCQTFCVLLRWTLEVFWKTPIITLE